MRAGSLRAEQSEALRREWRAGSYGLLEGAAGAGAGQGPGGAARAGGGWGCNKGWLGAGQARNFAPARAGLSGAAIRDHSLPNPCAPPPLPSPSTLLLLRPRLSTSFDRIFHRYVGQCGGY
jgi:hypothetical protein